jgi:thiol-disulfide isomerase/thioredoxin
MNGKIGTALAVAGSLLAIALVARSGHPPPPAGGPVARVNLAYTVEDMSGAKIDLATFAGKPLLINLWATWCGPCRLEMPQLEALSAKFRDRGLVVIGISTDDQPDAIRAIAKEYQITYPMLVGLGQDALIRGLGYEDVLPYSILVRADGTVTGRITGLATTEDWERRIAALLQ